MRNLSLAKWKAHEPSVGAWIGLADLTSAETLARMGFEWLCFDLQHGLLTYADLLALIPAISGTPVTPIVRVTSNDAGQIGRALDAGAHGVIVPMIESAEEAARAAAACRYPPSGNRSCGPMRGLMLEGFEYLATANAQVACIAMIETRRGLDNVAEIAAVEGVDALFIGPVDLCFGLGIAPGNSDDPAFIDAVATIRETAHAAGKTAGMFGYSAELARKYLAEGFDFASAGTDSGFLRAGATAAMAVAQGRDGAAREGY